MGSKMLNFKELHKPLALQLHSNGQEVLEARVNSLQENLLFRTKVLSVEQRDKKYTYISLLFSP